jgi:DNA-binding PadR family transcriptional regulator
MTGFNREKAKDGVSPKISLFSQFLILLAIESGENCPPAIKIKVRKAIGADVTTYDFDKMLFRLIENGYVEVAMVPVPGKPGGRMFYKITDEGKALKKRILKAMAVIMEKSAPPI